MTDSVCFASGALAEHELQELATRMAAIARPPLVVCLVGELGAGKTTFTRALVKSLGHKGSVKSPTYGLLEHYELPTCKVLHLDLYRLGDPGELHYLGIADLLDSSTLLFVEWPERGEGFLPAADIEIRFFHSGKMRKVVFLPKSDSGKSICEQLSPLLSLASK